MKLFFEVPPGSASDIVENGFEDLSSPTYIFVKRRPCFGPDHEVIEVEIDVPPDSWTETDLLDLHFEYHGAYVPSCEIESCPLSQFSQHAESSQTRQS
jgi:hypothetical protein